MNYREWAEGVRTLAGIKQPFGTLTITALRGKPHYDGIHSLAPGTDMSTLLVCSKGQIVSPASLRRRFGMGAGARIEVFEASAGLNCTSSVPS